MSLRAFLHKAHPHLTLPPSLPPSYQAACEVTAVVFDKTGTLTTGKAVVTDEVSVCNLLLEAGREGGGEGGQAAAPPTAEEEKQARRRVLALAAAVETGSEHPVAQVSPPSLPPSLPSSLASKVIPPTPPSLPPCLPPPLLQAILRHAKGQGLRVPSASSFEITPGLGVAAQVEGMVRKEGGREGGREGWDDRLSVTQPVFHTWTPMLISSSLPPSLPPSLLPSQGRVAVGNARFLEEAEGLSLSSTLTSLPTYPPPSLPPSLPESNTNNGNGGSGGTRAGGRKGRRTSVADARRALEAQGKTVVFVAAEGR